MRIFRLWPTAALAVLLLSLPGCGQKQTPDVPGARTETNAVPDVPVEMTAPEEEEITAMMERDEYLAMPVYPAQGCIRKIDDTWVVRLAPN